MIDDATRREIVYSSNLERDLACMLLADRRIANVADQPPAVFWIDDRGRKRRHTLDFLATTVAGRRIGIAVKPEARVVSSGIEKTLERIRVGPSRNQADEFVLRTDRHISRDRAADARLIIRARRTRVAEDVRVLAEFIRRTNGRLTVRTVCDAFPDMLAVFMRVVNLVDEGLLERVDPSRLSPASHVRRAVVAVASIKETA